MLWVDIALGLAIVEILVLLAGYRYWSSVVWDAFLKWLFGPYEQSLYDALGEMYRTEEVGNKFRIWQQNFRLLHALRLHWMPEVRRELKKLHNSREGRFSWVVMVDTTPSGGWATLTLRPWSVVVLDPGGKELAAYYNWTRLKASRVGELLEVFCLYQKATTVLIKDHNDKVVGSVGREQLESLEQSEKELVVDGGWLGD